MPPTIYKWDGPLPKALDNRTHPTTKVSAPTGGPPRALNYSNRQAARQYWASRVPGDEGKGALFQVQTAILTFA